LIGVEGKSAKKTLSETGFKRGS